MENIDYTSLLEASSELSPLLQAVEVKKITAMVGFDFENTESAMLKLEEEINELKDAIKNKDAKNLKEEIGDALFMLANVAQKASVEPMEALKASNKKFIERFKYVINKMQEANFPMKKENLDKMEAFYQDAKINEKKFKLTVSNNNFSYTQLGKIIKEELEGLFRIYNKLIIKSIMSQMSMSQGNEPYGWMRIHCFDSISEPIDIPIFTEIGFNILKKESNTHNFSTEFFIGKECKK